MNNIVIVGAGPIGLSTAIQAKLRNPELNITLLDKNETYVRTQMLLLEKSSFSNMPKHSELNEIIQGFCSKKMVPIQEIEAKLKELAKRIGIQFEKMHVKKDSFEELSEKFPDAGCIIGADGARSVVREKVFSGEFAENSTVQYLVEVKYKVEDKPKVLASVKKIVGMKFAKTFVQETVSKTTSQVSLRFFVDQQTFEKVKDAKEKEAWSLKAAPEDLQEKVNDWIRIRENSYEEKRITEPTLTSIELKVYNAKKTVKEDSGRIVCLVGDAAGGVPFFRSINKGFLESSELSKVLAEKPKDNETTQQTMTRFKVYEEKAQSIAYWENLAAKVKSFFIDRIVSLIKVARLVTPQVILKWLGGESLSFYEKYGMTDSHPSGEQPTIEQIIQR